MLALLLASSAWAGDFLHGYAKGALDVPLALDPVPVPRARLQLDLGQRQEQVSWRAAVDLDVDASGTPSLLPVELKVGLHGRRSDLVAGKQHVFWGTTDWVNPTDIFTPWDYTNMTSELEDYRIAPWALRWTGWAGNSSVDLVWVPVPQPDVTLVPGTVSDGVLVGERVLPDTTSAGIRLTTSVWGFDLAAMGFRGLDKRASVDVQVDMTTMPPGVTLVPTHGTLWAVGGDVARGFGPVLFKGEAAWYLTDDREGTDPVIRNPEIYSVAGLTWVPDSSLNFTVQGTWSHLLHYSPEAEAENWDRKLDADLGADVVALAEAMGMAFATPEPGPTDSLGLVERAAWTWKDTVGLSLVGVQGAEDWDHFEMLLVTWRVADGLEALGGVILFGGPEGSRFGGLEDASMALAEVKASF